MRRLLFLPLMLLLPFLAACAIESDASPEASPSSTASPTPAKVAVTPTSTPDQTAAALTPTAAPSTPTLTPTPSQGAVLVTPAPSGPPVFARPPAATAAAGGVSVAMGIGTYCWSAPGSNGICADAAGPVTGAQELVVAPGERIDVTTGFPGSEIREAVASAIAVSDTQGKPINTGELVWNFPPVGGRQLPTTTNAGGVSFPAPSQPGRYVVTLFLRPASGDVAYGVALDVR